jgi:succinate dehydrogenase / fumarate reductase cytochrome b subunit
MSKIGLVEPKFVYDFEGHAHPDFYLMAIDLLKQPLYAVIYILSFMALGFHLNHAIQSGFQSMGWEHSKYTPAIKIVSTLYSLLIAIGFSIIPIYFLFIG